MLWGTCCLFCRLMDIIVWKDSAELSKSRKRAKQSHSYEQATEV